MHEKDFNTTLQKIKSRAYWRIEIYPTAYSEDKFKLTEMLDVLRDSTVKLRGWDYPHFIDNKMENRFNRYPVDGNRYEAWIDWANHKEIWRFYTSGKFTHLFSINEQWFDDFDPMWGPTQWANDKTLQTSVDAIGIIYKVTEILEFLNRFAHKDNLEELVLKISIENGQDNKLVILEPRRAGLLGEYINHSTSIKAYDGILQHSSIAIKDSRLKIGSNIIQSIFSYFDWQASDALINTEQHNLLNRKL